MKLLIVVDVQNDFVDGVLGSAEAQATIPNIMERLLSLDKDTEVIFTRDTHDAAYMNTQEGRKLPVPHCIEGSEGWQIVPCVKACVSSMRSEVVNKPVFGSFDLLNIVDKYVADYGVESIELLGFCTDICVLSNAILLRNCFTEIPISVNAACCAGVTPAKHEAALEAMRSCQIDII